MQVLFRSFRTCTNYSNRSQEKDSRHENKDSISETIRCSTNSVASQVFYFFFEFSVWMIHYTPPWFFTIARLNFPPGEWMGGLSRALSPQLVEKNIWKNWRRLFILNEGLVVPVVLVWATILLTQLPAASVSTRSISLLHPLKELGTEVLNGREKRHDVLQLAEVKLR